MTSLFYDPLFLAHHPGPRHPESPARLQAILQQLGKAPLPGVKVRTPQPAPLEALTAVHPQTFVESMLGLSGHSGVIDADTLVSPRSIEAAVLAAGAALNAVDAVLHEADPRAFALVRPPGHHAEPEQAMGFCLFNNAAIAAEAARRQGIDRVAILDWDVHHGNGTQEAFYRRSDVLYLSTHQWPFYPGTGAAEETGEGEGEGFNLNVPLPAGMTDADYGAVFHDLLLPRIENYQPGLLIISAGFDAHRADPLANMNLSERGFAAMTSAVRDLANHTCGGKLVVLLEGGYDLSALGLSVHSCLEAMEGRKDGFTSGVSRQAAEAIQRTRLAWKSPP